MLLILSVRLRVSCVVDFGRDFGRVRVGIAILSDPRRFLNVVQGVKDVLLSRRQPQPLNGPVPDGLRLQNLLTALDDVLGFHLRQPRPQQPSADVAVNLSIRRLINQVGVGGVDGPLGGHHAIFEVPAVLAGG